MISGHQFAESWHNLPEGHPLKPVPQPGGGHAVQLPMFMTAREISGTSDTPGTGAYHPLFDDRAVTYRPIRFEEDEELYSRKLRESDEEGLTDRLLTEGVKSPVALGLTPKTSKNEVYDDSMEPTTNPDDIKPEIVGGHHRVAVMRHHDPDRLMPVMFFQRKNDFDNDDMEAAATDPNYIYNEKIPLPKKSSR